MCDSEDNRSDDNMAECADSSGHNETHGGSQSEDHFVTQNQWTTRMVVLKQTIEETTAGQRWHREAVLRVQTSDSEQTYQT